MISHSILVAVLAALVAASPLERRAASCGNEGVEYAVFDLKSNKIGNNGPGYTAFAPIVPKLQNELVPEYGGVCNKLGYNVNSGSDPVYDRAIGDAGWFAVEHRFYICAPVTGKYCFKVEGKQDDTTLAWIGQEAYSGYTLQNAKINDGFYGGSLKEHTCTLNAGQEIPVRIITGECDAPATFGFSITGPNGLIIGPNSGPSQYIKRWVCGNDKTKFPPYKQPAPPGPQNTCSNGGVNYGIFALEGGDRIQNVDKGYTNIGPVISKLQTMEPNAVGVTKVLGFDSGPASQAKKLYQSEWTEYNWFAVEHRFYICATETGDYSFKTSRQQDDTTLVWVGDSAYSGYSLGNAILNDGYYGTVKGKEVKVPLKCGTRTAVRVITVECAVPAVFDLTITTPSGKVLIGPNTEASPHVVQWFCNNEKPKFPPYKPVKPKPLPPVTPPVKPVTPVTPPNPGYQQPYY